MTKRGDQLIRRLYADPMDFKEKGLAYQLLLEMFEGHSLDSVRPLLTSADSMVQHAGVFVASELGASSVELLDELIPLTRSDDIYIRYNAIESVAAATSGGRMGDIVHVLLALGDSDSRIRKLAMRIAARVSIEHLKASRDRLKEHEMSDHRRLLHQQGLEKLVEGKMTSQNFKVLLRSSEPLLQRYGAIAAARSNEADSFEDFDCSPQDTDLEEFLREYLRPSTGE